MTTNLTTDNILNVPIGNIAKYETKQLYELLTEATGKLDQAKKMRQWMHSAIALKYDVFMKTKRQRLEKDTGIIHIDEPDFKISNDVPKKVEWNQKLLGKVAGELVIKGTNLSDYIEVTYHIPEAKYNTLPLYIKDMVNPARIIKLGNPDYKITKRTQEINQEGYYE